MTKYFILDIAFGSVLLVGDHLFFNHNQSLDELFRCTKLDSFWSMFVNVMGLPYFPLLYLSPKPCLYVDNNQSYCNVLIL